MRDRVVRVNADPVRISRWCRRRCAHDSALWINRLTCVGLG